MNRVKLEIVTVRICPKCTVDYGKNIVVDFCDDCKEPLEYLDINNIYCDELGNHYCEVCKDKKTKRGRKY